MQEFQVNKLTVTVGSKQLLKDITFNVESGEFICIVGPSGAGKSTLLKQLNRLDCGKSGGEVVWKGQNVETYEIHDLRRKIAYIPQKAVMFPGNAEENIKLSLKFGVPAAPDTDKLYSLVLKETEIDQKILETEAVSLSGGQQQRVGIARVLMLNPPVLLLDEPTASLDVETSNAFCKTLKKMKGVIDPETQSPRTFFMVTHRLEEAHFLADKVLMLQDGEVVEFTEASKFFTNPQTQRAKDFIQAENLSGHTATV